MALRHEAVLVNAGSYVINPKSSSDTLILRRSMALMVPSVIGTSYCLPVRLSVIVSVSAIASHQGRRLQVGRLGVVRIHVWRRVIRRTLDAVGAVEPVGEVQQLAAFTAERLPARIHGLLATVYTEV